MKRKHLRTALIVLLALVFLGSAGMLAWKAMEYRQGEASYDEAAALAGETESQEQESGDAAAKRLAALDLGALQAVNPEVLGWLQIPGTTISYPLVQHSDNSYYLRRTWEGAQGSVGSIFMEARCAANFSDFHTILYGHNMRVGSMFGTLGKYREQSWRDAHPWVYVTDGNGCRRYEIFAAFETTTQAENYRILFADEAEKQTFLDYCQEQSLITGGEAPATDHRVLTLSTCASSSYSSRRFVVLAVLRDSFDRAGNPITAGN